MGAVYRFEFFRSGVVRKRWRFRFVVRVGNLPAEILFQSQGYSRLGDAKRTAESIALHAADAGWETRYE